MEKSLNRSRKDRKGYGNLSFEKRVASVRFEPVQCGLTRRGAIAGDDGLERSRRSAYV